MPSKTINLAILAVLTAIILVVSARQLSVGGLSWSDAPLHTMDGVFIHDLLIEHPTGDLKNWAKQFYLKHQCLGIVVYYPPLFAAVEAVVFLTIGVSIVAARLTVLLFVIGAVWLIYWLTRRLFGTSAGIAAAILTLTTTAGVTWSRIVMLEWPATFFILLTLWAYRQYRENPRWIDGILIALGIAGSYFTKQTAVFVLLVILLHVIMDKRRRDIYRRSLLIPMITALLLIGVYAVATAGYNKLAPQLIAGSPPFRHLISFDNWIWYIRELPGIIGWPMLIGLILAGITILATSIKSPKDSQVSQNNKERTQIHKRNISLPVIWFCLWWLICTVFAANETRYFFFAVPPAAILVATGLLRLDGQRRLGIGSLLLIVLCSIQTVTAVLETTYRLPNMQPTVEFLARQNDADLVLVDAVRDGQFIFDVRTTPQARNRIIPMRASKFLYSRAARTKYDYQAHINNRQELIAWLDQLGIRYLVIEDRLPITTDRSADPPPRIMLRQTLQEKQQFEPVFSQSLAGNHPHWQKVNLVTYRYLNAKTRRSNTITIRIPAMGKELSFTLPTPDSQPVKTNQY
ncbi:MAG: glycosyltransferase family 39 protein [Planctomycetota bacterium]|nr:MAG: glycosyltransferase family 39 protein [Planctomycetota bacterium]